MTARTVRAASKPALRAVARGGAAGLVGAAAGAALNLALTLLVTRSLGPTGAGVVFATVALFHIAHVAGKLGADTGLVRELAHRRALGKESDAHALAALALAPVAVIGILGAIVGVWQAPWIARAVLPEAPAGMAIPAVQALALAVPFGSISMVALGGARGLGSVRPMVLVENVGKPAARLATTAAVLTVWPSALAATIAWAVPVVAGCLTAVGMSCKQLRRMAPDSTTPTTPTSILAKDFWSFAGPRGIAAVLEVIGQTAGLLIVSALAGPHAAGVFAAVSRCVLLGALAMQAIRLAIASRLSSTLATGQTAAAEHIHRVSVVWICALSWPLCLIAATAPRLILGAFGPGFEEGAPALTLLCVATLFNLSTGNVGTVMLMAGGSGANLMATLASLTTNITLCLILIPRLGVIGAALAWTAAILVENIIMLAVVRITLGVRTFSSPLKELLAWGGVFLAGPLMIADWIGFAQWATVAIAAVGISLYALALGVRRARWHGDDLLKGLSRSTPPARR